MTLRNAMLALLLGTTSLSVANGQTTARRGNRPAAAKLAAAPLPIVTIPYEKFFLPNGLTVIVNEDHGAPVVTMTTYLHVGSANETTGRTGFAHLFEHLMFNGSEHANDDWFKFMNEIGAMDMNGSTGNDRTNYYQTVPKGGLDLLLWYESDRMANLLPVVDPARLDEQRKVVQNEKRQRANDPLGALPDAWYAATYPVGHPYSWTTIGSMDDLNAAGVEDVKSFFRKWYGPSNTVIALSGDLSVAEARAKVEKYYGDIPAGPALVRAEERPAKMIGDSRGTLQAPVASPQLLIGWNVPGWASEDAQLLQLAASSLSGSQDSPMNKRLVRDLQLASVLRVSCDTLELGSQFQISATARPGVSLERLEAAIKDEMAKFLRDGVIQQRLDRIRFQEYADMVRIQTSTNDKAALLAEGELYAGTPDFYRKRQEIKRNATPASIQEVARKWLSDGSFTMEIVPFTEHTVSGKAVDRKVKPVIAKIGSFTLPPLQQAMLSNGAKVMLAERHDAPTINLSMMFDIGTVPERDPALKGLATAFAFSAYGTTSRSALEIDARQEEVGGRIGWNSSAELTAFNMSALKIKLDETLDLYSDVLLNPAFPADEWERRRALFNQSFEDNKRTPGGKVSNSFPKLLYGPSHPYGVAVTPEMYAKVSTEDFRRYYRKWIRPDLATILIVGDTTLAEIMPMLERRLSAWKAVGPKPVKPPLPEALKPTGPRVVLYDQPGAESSVIAVAETGPARKDPDFDALSVANTIIGGNFVSRLNLNLREEKGWSYGAKSEISTSALLGTIGAGSTVQTDKTADAMREIAREMREVSTTRPPTEKEMETAKNAMLLGFSGQLQSPSGALELYRSTYQNGLPEDYWNNYIGKVQSFTLPQIQSAATRLYRQSELTWFVVGDLAKIEADIRKLNLGEVMVYDADGKRVR